MNSESKNSHSTNANFDQLHHITKKKRTTVHTGIWHCQNIKSIKLSNSWLTVQVLPWNLQL